MDIDYSLNAISVRKTGFFYEGERKVLYSDFKKPTDTARRNKIRRGILKTIYESANVKSKKRYDSYLRIISVKEELGEFPSDAPKPKMTKEALLGLRDGKITQQILVGIKTGEITRKTIRDELVKYIVENLGWKLPEDSEGDHATDHKQQSGSESMSASGIGDTETKV